MTKIANTTSDSDTILINAGGPFQKKRSNTGTLYGMVPKNKQGVAKGLTNTALKFDGRNE